MIYIIIGTTVITTIVVGGLLVYYFHRTHQHEIQSWEESCKSREKMLEYANINLKKEKDLVIQANNKITTLNDQIKVLSGSIRILDDRLNKITYEKNRTSTLNKSKVDPNVAPNKITYGGVINFCNNASECVICLEQVKTMTCFIPCGHISTCSSCAKCMTPPSCPICRCKNGQFYNIYNATNNTNNITNANQKGKDVEVEAELHPEEIVKRKSLIRRFLDKF